MNQFEIRANALRLRYKAEREQMQKACEEHVGHLNTAMGQVTLPEAVGALKDERERVKEATRRSIAWSRLRYRQKLELLNDEYRRHLAENPSKRAQRRAAAV